MKKILSGLILAGSLVLASNILIETASGMDFNFNEGEQSLTTADIKRPMLVTFVSTTCDSSLNHLKILKSSMKRYELFVVAADSQKVREELFELKEKYDISDAHIVNYYDSFNFMAIARTHGWTGELPYTMKFDENGNYVK